MKRWLLLVPMLAIWPVAAAGAQQPDPGEAGQVHVVRSGETLWDLARRYLDDPFRWQEIFSLNRESIRDPHRIFPEDRLLLPRGLGGVAAAVTAAEAGPIEAEETVPLRPVDAASERTVFFDAEAEGSQAAAVQPIARATAPVVPPGAFFGAGIVLPDEEVAAVGQLVERVGPTVIPARMPLQIQPYDRVFVTLSQAVPVGTRLHLLRPDRPLGPYGRIFRPTGTARVLEVREGVATVEVDGFYDEVRVGDLAVPMPAFPVPSGVLPSPAEGLEGTLLGFADPQPIAATESLVYLDLGSRSGVVEGDEFTVFIPPRQEAWGQRPEIEVARLQVVRAGALTSAARVVALEHAALVPGLPLRLVAKMP